MDINNCNSTNFKANSRAVMTKAREIKYRTNTWFFRGDLPWDEFVKYADKRFEKLDKVPIINFACSDGEESYSLAYKLIENVKENVNKFFPIYASDFDSLNIKKALSSEPYNIDCYEAEKAKELGKPFMEYFDIYYGDDGYPEQLRPLENLKNKIIFKKSNMISDVQKMQKGNKIILLRNCLPYLRYSEREIMFKNLQRICTGKSLLVIGDYDVAEIFLLKEELLKYGFLPTKIKNVYKKVSNPVLQKICKCLSKHK